ncbi:hypothetical protein ACFY8C_16920 [Streptomyces flavochromogenes]|uniref:Uncharacterized protein n=1 Tax=Streptomyces flavochromogenes TaxID=68199 RepID=A0ABW6XR63_9ACTN|nr:hypothetical protein [Streptomyces flavochromogenes]
MAVDHDIVGSVGVEVVPIAPTFHRHMERVVIPAAEQVGQQAGRILGDRMADAIVRQVAAFKAMPKLNVSLADGGVTFSRSSREAWTARRPPFQA